MISLRAAILRELIRLYTYPYRKRHMSLSRSVKLKSVGFTPPRGLAVRTEMFGGVRTEVTYNPSAENAGGNIIQFHGGGHTAAMNNMYRKVACIYAKMSTAPFTASTTPRGRDLYTLPCTNNALPPTARLLRRLTAKVL